MKKGDKISTIRNVGLGTTTFHFCYPKYSTKTIVITTGPLSYRINIKHLTYISIADFYKIILTLHKKKKKVLKHFGFQLPKPESSQSSRSSNENLPLPAEFTLIYTLLGMMVT